jgi:hypothetical protein
VFPRIKARKQFFSAKAVAAVELVHAGARSVAGRAVFPSAVSLRGPSRGGRPFPPSRIRASRRMFGNRK